MDNEEKTEREFSFRQFWGDSKIRCRVDFRRNATNYCIYCGNLADTREHSPSKVFLHKPYPNDLPVLPACKRCNNSFSDDELYSEVYIDSLKYISGVSKELTLENKERLYKSFAYYDAQCDYYSYLETGEIPSREKTKKIFVKLALCHSIYELLEGYAKENSTFELKSIEYFYRFEKSDKEIKEFLMPIMMNDKVLPQLGSRAYENIQVLEPVLKSLSDESTQKIQLVIMLWTIIQENEYEYVAWIDNDEINVRIAIHDFVFINVTFGL